MGGHKDGRQREGYRGTGELAGANTRRAAGRRGAWRGVRGDLGGRGGKDSPGKAREEKFRGGRHPPGPMSRGDRREKKGGGGEPGGGGGGGAEAGVALGDPVDTLVASNPTVTFHPFDGDLARKSRGGGVDRPEGIDQGLVGLWDGSGRRRIDGEKTIAEDDGGGGEKERDQLGEKRETDSQRIELGDVVGAKAKSRARIVDGVVVLVENTDPSPTGTRVGGGGAVGVTDERRSREGGNCGVVVIRGGGALDFGFGLRDHVTHKTRGELDDSVARPGLVAFRARGKSLFAE